MLENFFFRIQKVWFRAVMVGATLLFLGVFLYGAFVHTMLPKDIENDYVPFVEEAQKTLPFSDKIMPLDQPNRSYIEMEDWVFDAMSKALTFTSQDYQERLTDMRENYFSPSAYADYTASLQQTRLEELVLQQNNKTTVFLDEPPSLLNEGAVDGRYSWLYDVSLVITYIPATQTEYRNVNDAKNVAATVRIQVGRELKEGDPFAVRIDNWKLTGRRNTPY